ncbi:cupin domain-containing protein [Yeosuana sp. MJ-SS3]|jgi:predicted cupin superfamily sugar epimerase|uniref:Cupin domain-containing protein n=1 Tax=Gilvirhabdus luticola TaxID=3079858 RepID=A0ABU3U581_9FLAO|nr:cupin domain-containing protein [Yeosuana sp. MJ-SS3]MDU8885564.1 cupin domain-containing protein [Yeosuana sp. MJ-SS3]
MDIEYLIKELDLQPHPEGGFFKEVYRSTGTIGSESLDSRYSGKRNYATSIYFLLTSDTFSAFHKINQDEVWHFYDGSPIKIHMISEDGEYSYVIVGRNLKDGEKLQFVVPGGSWFAANVINQNDYSLVGCTVSPGFDFKDFQLADRNELIAQYPKYKEIIFNLTIA